MDFIKGFLLNYLFFAPVVGWLLATFLKAILASVMKKKLFRLKEGFLTGGMPSTHSVFVSSITTAIGMTQGFTPLFFASLCLSLVVISDAFGVRKNIGQQGDALNDLLKRMQKDPIRIAYGHTFMQVLAGILWGAGTAVLFYYLFLP